MESSPTRERSSSPPTGRPASPHSSASSSTSSVITAQNAARPSSSLASSIQNLGGGLGSGSMSLSRSQSDSIDIGPGGYGAQIQSGLGSGELLNEPSDVPRAGDSISVTIRFRPLSDREFQRGDEVCWYPDGDKIVRNEYNPATAYAFDKVFGPDTATPEVYEVAAKPVVKAAMDGVTGTVFAYGVTSSGKTHTMHGDHYTPGIIPLAIKDVFSIIQETPGREFLLRVSYLEIYNEVINDLLDPTGQNLRVREDAQGTYVEGIKEEVVLSPGHALSFIAAGEEHRHVGSNNFNLLSSRSHTIFTLMIESSATGDEYEGVVFSQLNLIDLAGSESSKTETTGLRRKEGSYINKSLLTLGTVIGKLSEGRATHVPYRDSKLTRLLQSSLSGHGHVSLICTITPASSNMEETHNTLKFANRAKCIEIYASRNMIIDEKFLIKKYQREIASLKQEMEQMKRGMLVGVNHEQLLTLKQQLEEGQVKMQSRLEEEEDAKAALMSRIQRLTKLILVSSRNTVPARHDVPAHHQSNSVSENGGSLLIGSGKGENPSYISEGVTDSSQTESSGNCNGEASPANSTVTEPVPIDELLSGSDLGEVTMADKVDLYVEQVKLLTEDIALSSSTLKRLVEQSANDPECSKAQIQNLEAEIEEKKMRVKTLEQLINESGEASVVSASLVEMQQTITRLTAQYDEKTFELELRTADNYILQDQLHKKNLENKDLQEKVNALQQQLVTVVDKLKSQSEDFVSVRELNDLKRKLQLKANENEKMRLERIQYVEENSGLRVQNQKLAEEASYAKELASAAAVELKNLAGEVTKLSLQNAKLEKELVAFRAANIQSANGFNRGRNENTKPGARGRLSNRTCDFPENQSDDFDLWNLDQDDLIMELQARKQKEKTLQATLAEKELVENEYRKKVEDLKKREKTLEGDLANMWVLVAKLKKEAAVVVPQTNNDVRNLEGSDQSSFSKSIDSLDFSLREKENVVVPKPTQNHSPDEPKEESLIDRLKARMQEMKSKELKAQAIVDTKDKEVKNLGNTDVKEKEIKSSANSDTKEKELKTYGKGDMNSHLCKVCFESPTAAILLPCRHFCLCKSCSLACSECPICRSKISDRLFAFS
uniref:Uncharacterized protein n=1 Tax=Kalanchoe fedtschenkoi TaxID=63787 RepID=A0A7N0T253_KALFE